MRCIDGVHTAGTAALNCLAGFRVPVFCAAAFRLLGYCETAVFAGNARRMQFARVLLSCNGRAESKVRSGLVAFGRALGRIGSFSAGELCGWLNEAIRRVYTATALPVGVPQRLKVNFTWTVMATCILHRLAAMVLVTLDGISEWEKGAPGSRSTQRLRRL